jgi:hypothetical protein
MRSALQMQRSGAKRAAVTRTTTIPAPVRGLNARDAIADMKPTDAVILDNFFPAVSDVSLRLGSRAYATGMTGAVETIMSYRSNTTTKMFAIASGSLYDVTSVGPVGAAQLTGLSNSRWQWVNFGTPGGQFLLMVNGADPLHVYNGTSWSTEGLGAGATISSITFVGTTATVTTSTAHGLSAGNTVTVTGTTPSAYNVSGAAITVLSSTTFSYTMGSTPASNATVVGSYTYSLAVTGFDTSKAIQINAFGQRIWFVEKNSFRVWYLALQSIAGAATSLDLSSLFKLGGSLAGMVTWTVAGQTVTQQYAVFVSTQGEVVIFSGYDPASASTWAQVGTARIGQPVGNRFWTKLGTDVVMITADGFVPLSEVLQLDRKSNADAISNRIVNAANAAVQSYSSNFGWQVSLYPIGNKLFVNVPLIEGSKSIQYVMNTITGSWCSYSGLNANCWEATQSAIYFGGNGTVYQAEYGYDDNGTSIYGTMKPAFNYFGAPGLIKRFTQVKPVILGAGSPAIQIDLTVDFADPDPTSTPRLSAVSSLPQWGVTPWNTTRWVPIPQVISNWQAVSGMGIAAAARMMVNVKGAPFAFEAITYAYEVGGLF